MERTAVVTGGTRGLGKGISMALHDAGFRVAAIYYRDGDAARRFSDATTIPTYRWNVADFQACHHGLLQIEHDLGPVDVLINNAGVIADAFLHHMTPEQWLNVIQTNLGSMFNMSRNVIEGMRTRRFGRIVNVSSVNGRKGQAGQSNYCASKAGVLGFTRALALESAANSITVNAIAPGYCDTELLSSLAPETLQKIIASIPAGRLGLPSEIGRIVAFLASDEAGYINGATFDVNGGQFMG